jgi:hypothetical protein
MIIERKDALKFGYDPAVNPQVLDSETGSKTIPTEKGDLSGSEIETKEKWYSDIAYWAQAFLPGCRDKTDQVASCIDGSVSYIHLWVISFIPVTVHSF